MPPYEKIITFAPAMNRSRTYNPTLSRRALPASPAHVYAPAGGTQLLWDTSKPMANGQLQINNSQRPTPNPQFPMPRWTFTFSAKEKDAETGFSYFGSRYYNSDLSIWLSVDPQAAKYPSLSPYVYCADNPVKLVDPNGEEVYDGGDPSKRIKKFFDKKIKTPLMKMAKNGASADELESEAVTLSNKYQKQLRRKYQSKDNTYWDGEEIVDIKVFSETKKIINVKNRADNQEMIVCGEIPVGPDVYAAEIDFNPYGVENYATFIAADKVETGWINSPEGNSFSYNLEVGDARSISYCIQNRLTDKRQDNWKFSVTLRSRRLDIRPVARVSDYRTHKKHVRMR